jgi:hypothetical protein
MLYLDVFLPEFGSVTRFGYLYMTITEVPIGKKQETFEFLPPFLSFPSRPEDVLNKV